MKKIIGLILISIFAFSLVSCQALGELFPGLAADNFDPSSKNYTPSLQINTTAEGIYITIESVEFVDGHPIFNVNWHNETDRLICFGVGYRIEILEGENWSDRMIEDFPIIEIACMLNPGETGRQTYKGQFFDFRDNGTYRLLVEFYFSDEVGGSGTTYACFDVTDK